MNAHRSRRLACLMLSALVACALLAACGGDDSSDTETGATAAEGSGELVGLFAITAGTCGDAEPQGSYFTMVQPGGTPDGGPFVDNVDSSCSDKTVTPLSPGTDGGLRTGTYQPQPDPVFDELGSSNATAVIEPQSFFAVRFGISTNEADPQTGTTVPAPSVHDTGGALTGDLSALSVSWNGQHFNQGAPKPGGSAADGTPAVTGTYDAATGAYTLDWSSLIEGGPFDGFTGLWHLEGTFTAS